ncbi:MAG: hypothetical protein WC315_00855 [Candidatus Omnitrophota bacterium]|jgi:hypothetical protein
MLTKTERYAIANAAIAKLGARRAMEASRPVYPPIPNPTGFDGVDLLPGRYPRYRARIRFCDALSGQDTRITLGTRFDSAEQAGYAYAAAHVKLWGAVSRYTRDISPDELQAMIDGGR